MALTRERRRRGEAKETLALNTRLKPENKAKIDTFADLLGISQARALDLILENVEVDDHGKPSWYEGELPDDGQGALPLTG